MEILVMLNTHRTYKIWTKFVIISDQSRFSQDLYFLLQ